MPVSVCAFLVALADRLEQNPTFNEEEAKKLAHDCRNQAHVALMIAELNQQQQQQQPQLKTKAKAQGVD